MTLSLSYIHSTGQTSLPDAIQEAATGSEEIAVAAAFLTMGGARELVDLMDRMARKRHRRVQVIAGLTGVTDPDALRLLLEDARVELRLSRDPAFHVKLYAFYGTNGALCLTGSANLTAKGMTGEGELLVRLADSLKSPLATRTKDVFRRMWDQATDADKKTIDAYAKSWKRPSWKPQMPGAVRKRLKRAPKPKGPARKPVHLWFPAVRALSSRALAAIKESTHWSGRSPTDNSEVLGTPTKGNFDKIDAGDYLWSVSFFERVEDRVLEKCRVLGKCVEEIKGEGTYWYSTGPAEVSIPLPKILDDFKAIGIVGSWSPRDDAEHPITAGKLRKLENLVASCSKPKKKVPKGR